MEDYFKRRILCTVCYISCTCFFVQRSLTVPLHITYTVNRFKWIFLQVNFRKIGYILRTITIKSFFQCIWNIRTFYTSRYACLCAALLLSVCSRFGRLYFMVECFYTFLCSVVLVRNYFHNSVQEIRKFYFIIFQLAIQPTYLYVVGITVFKRTLGFPTFSQNQVVFPYPT